MMASNSIVINIAGTQALNDSGLTYKDIQQAVVGYVYGELLAFFTLK